MLDTSEQTLNPAPSAPARAPVFPKVPLNYEDEEELTPEQRAEMFGHYEESLRSLGEGEIVRGTVLAVDDKEVLVDVGFKSEGVIALSEFPDPSSIQVGQTIDVFLEKMENQDGLVVLSKQRADFVRVWDKVKEAHDAGQVVEGKLVRKIKGGVVVDLYGVEAFLPGSQIALRQVQNVDALLGQAVQVKIIKLNKRRRNIVVSRRAVLEQERDRMKANILKDLAKDQIREGQVKNITDFGAFVDLGGIDGLLHITDMSWGRVGHPSELVKIGDRVRVKVLNFDPEKERISLGLKQLESYPWEGVDTKYKVGDRIKGRVVSITDYGAFVELEKGVEGLVHVSEMSWTRHVRHPSKVVNIGDIIDAVVLKVDKANEKISLGLKQTEPDPWLTLDEKYPPGMKVKGKVRNLTNFGAFVELEEGIDGLVHVSDMSWTKRVAHPSEVLKKGESVEVVILSIDKEHRRISLGLKQVSEDPWPQLAERFLPGMELAGTINRLFDRGAIVDLGNGIEGFVPLSQLGIDDLKRPNDAFESGESLTMKVTRVDVPNHRLILSVKAWLAEQDDIALAEWTSRRNQVRARIAANPPAEEPEESKGREKEKAEAVPEE
ncbi:MAG: 30S ribosomal protein S1 [Candidatus Eisenbacteria bacterium]|uniref:30S ribosomal protein S1 n=1 Tax=Eiseniibacteriota bacterium TaxID=2212470 RepID=A0A9D6L5C2_UNCEI|nr:30S ribosomal protein S1 [Candidatus Eisenbacteria bacterium]MBI3540132.1 30S ribosomal protein S1 [Candidatus Eisenbacteria bacterium]